MSADNTTQDKVTRLGRLYGVGIGPGDPELLTLKARRVLTGVPVIFVPKKSADDRSIAESIIIDQMPDAGLKITGIILPMLKDKKRLHTFWQQAADVIWHHLNQGKDGAFVNVGDPLFYGTFIHVMKTVQSSHPEIEIEIIPGVTSVNAAVAGALIPLASDDDNVAVISGDQPDDIIRNALENYDAVVFMKVNTVFERLLGILEETELKDKSIYVRRCTTINEEIVRDINSLQGKKLDYFSLLIVRK